MSFRLFLGLICLFASGMCFSQIYKWVDEEGKVHFGDKKVQGVDQDVVALDDTKSDWTRFDINIKAIGVELSEQENKNISDDVNNVYEFFDRILFFDIYKTVPVNILILKDRNEYTKYLIQKKRGNMVSSYGIYFSKENQIVVYLRENRDDTFKTIRHEVSHAVVDTIVPYSPAWLNEGLAEQMETLQRTDAGLYIEPHTGNQWSVANSLDNNNLTSIDEFLKLPSDKWRHSLVDGQKNLQSQAGQFVYFLLSTQTSQSFVMRLMHKFKRGDRTLSYYLVDDNYIGGVKALEVKWNNWVKRQSNETIEFF